MTEVVVAVAEANDDNQQIIDEFRANGGKVGGVFEGAPLLLLHSTGAKSGRDRVNPLMYQEVGEELAVFASKAGAPTNPDWYYNLRAHPEAKIELGTETVAVRARVAAEEERARIWERQKQQFPNFAEYEKTAGGRQIPVVLLSRTG
jgi:deazaflavin-dependent oxidoreductase (nitroreductase family)